MKEIGELTTSVKCGISFFARYLDPKTTRRYIHFMPKDKRATVESIPFEF